MFEIVKDHQSRISIIIYRTPKIIGLLTTDGCRRDFEKIPAEGFGRHHQPLEYDLRRICEKWLDDPIIQPSQKARRTLVMIIAILDNKVIAKAESANLLSRIAPESAEIIDLSALETMSGVEIARIHNMIITGGTMDRARNKAQVAELIRKEIDKMATETEAADSKAKKAAEKAAEKERKAQEKAAEKERKAQEKAAAKTAAAANRAPRGAGVVAKVHAICADNPDKGRSEVVKLCVEAGINEGTAKTQYQVWHKKNKAQ